MSSSFVMKPSFDVLIDLKVSASSSSSSDVASRFVKKLKIPDFISFICFTATKPDTEISISCSDFSLPLPLFF